jgi:hypothetical protein
MSRVVQHSTTTLFKTVRPIGAGLFGGKRVCYGVLSMESYVRHWEGGQSLRSTGIAGCGQYTIAMESYTLAFFDNPRHTECGRERKAAHFTTLQE